MNLPTTPNTNSLNSMRKLGVEPGEDWTTARNKIYKALVKSGMDIMLEVFQSLLGERIDASDERGKRWGARFVMPLLFNQEALILAGLDALANEILSSGDCQKT